MLDVITVAAVAVSRASFDLAHSHGWDLDQQHSTARYRRSVLRNALRSSVVGRGQQEGRARRQLQRSADAETERHSVQMQSRRRGEGAPSPAAPSQEPLEVLATGGPEHLHVDPPQPAQPAAP